MSENAAHNLMLGRLRFVAICILIASLLAWLFSILFIVNVDIPHARFGLLKGSAVVWVGGGYDWNLRVAVKNLNDLLVDPRKELAPVVWWPEIRNILGNVGIFVPLWVPTLISALVVLTFARFETRRTKRTVAGPVGPDG